ncbi:hypothetical protein DICPUDRAFT_154444 [Dictyostelium purpureum]|uniref:O-acyltransferase n=1 Tax=Dictyostelium purpureum TaxID=5786 RepID=F0ZRC1_DICPU|nr:uncharacterized protein DICPUDRAFT_154444 [Dictyostelium purpureum]EGC33489.1 hypothetical protein DICPUDRAFT_154444 [Dictyostelium purpureum]|eukprot:XP_003289963.1 hypothetical protein DICPUDRAFT_154444 [Dictyostelium purpureum]
MKKKQFPFGESESDSEFFLRPQRHSSPSFSSSNGNKQSLTQRKIHTGSNNGNNNQNVIPPASISSSTSSNGSTPLGALKSDETKENEKKQMTMNGLFTLRPSILSSEATGATYRGFLNLLLILLITASFRLVILNHMLYGVRINFDLYKISEYHRWPGVMITLSFNLFIIAAYLIEKASALQKIPEKFCYILRILNCAGIIFIPSASIIAFHPNPASGIVVMIITCTFGMKIISYAYENSKQRKLNPDNKKFIANGDTSIYPNNLSLKNVYWFMLIPTLVYQLSYPRSPSIRKGYLLRRIVEAISLSLLILWMANQYMLPLVQNSILPMEQYDIVFIAERIMKLSLPNLYVWLLGFYVFFHLYLNIVAEITRFGDREFYRDWWNSTGLDYFWRTWNMPVHHWMVVLIYTPMRRRGFSKNLGYFMCFFVSAIFHELVISIPFHSLKLWGFFGIMSQMVLIALTKNLMNGRTLGNVIFWISIVLGQPLIVLLYYRNFVEENPEYYQNNTPATIPTMPFY